MRCPPGALPAPVSCPVYSLVKVLKVAPHKAPQALHLVSERLRMPPASACLVVLCSLNKFQSGRHATRCCIFWWHRHHPECPSVLQVPSLAGNAAARGRVLRMRGRQPHQRPTCARAHEAGLASSQCARHGACTSFHVICLATFNMSGTSDPCAKLLELRRW